VELKGDLGAIWEIERGIGVIKLNVRAGCAQDRDAVAATGEIHERARPRRHVVQREWVEVSDLRSADGQRRFSRHIASGGEPPCHFRGEPDASDHPLPPHLNLP